MPKVKVKFLKQCLSDLVQEYKHLKCEDGKNSFDHFEKAKISYKESQISIGTNDLEQPITMLKSCNLCGRKGKIMKFATKNNLNEHIMLKRRYFTLKTVIKMSLNSLILKAIYYIKKNF